MASTTSGIDFDAVVIGAGFSGLRVLHDLGKLGLSARVLERGTDVGGTWYWNRYPEAHADSEAWVYSYDFDAALMQDGNWTERFPRQPEVEQYLQHVADRFDMRKDIQFETLVTGASYDEDTSTWVTTTAQGETFRSRFLVSASGLLSFANKLPFPGVDSFEGTAAYLERLGQEGASDFDSFEVTRAPTPTSV